MTYIYFVATSKDAIDLLHSCGCRNVLVSFWYYQKLKKYYTLEDLSKMFDRVFVDSGAFSAFNSGVVIDMDEYYGFLKENDKWYTTAASFDVVGNAALTIRNTLIAFERGLRVQPVLQEDFDVCLRAYSKCRDLFDSYVLCAVELWDRYGFEHFTFMEGWKIHGFALVRESLIKSGIYSADSSRWSLSRFGQIGIYENGEGRMVGIGRIGRDSVMERMLLWDRYNGVISKWMSYDEFVYEGQSKSMDVLTIELFYKPLLAKYECYNKNFKSKECEMLV